MSSDSELDEFFDAEDATPNKSILEPVTEKTDELDEIEEAEKELMLLRRKQEERRRKEDEELKKRLQALEQKKQEAKEKIQETKKKDYMYLDRRRRKHEAFRQKVHQSGENISTEESDTSSNEGDLETDSPISSEQLSSEHNVNNSSQSREMSPTTMSLENSDKYNDISQNRNSPQLEKEKVSKQLHDFVSDSKVLNSTADAIQHTTGTIDHNMIDAKDLVENVLHETQLLSEENEPDIIKSTKARTPPSTLQQAAPPIVITTQPPVDMAQGGFVEPVAPPRRKKQLKINLDEVDHLSYSQRSSVSSLPSDGSLNRDTPQSPGLPSENSLESSLEIDKIARDLEHSLDLRSIIKGKKHIRAVDAEAHAVNSDYESPVQSLEAAGSKLSGLEQSCVDGKPGKSSSLDRKSKNSSLERRRSKSTSLESKKSSKSSSLEKEERRRSRNNSGQDAGRKEMSQKAAASASKLTDEEILESVMVKNLDTGEMVPLKDADKKIQQCMDPLVLHIMERTKDFPSEDTSDRDEDSKSLGGKPKTTEGRIKQKGAKLKKLLGKKMGKTYSKVKSVADQVMHGEENTTVLEADISEDSRKFKFKANHNKKGPYEFGQLKHVQDLGDHNGAIWVMKFSPCGRLLATGGQDSLLRIWVLDSAYNYFDDMRQKYVEMKVSPAPSQESLNSIPSLTPDISGMELGATAEGEEEKKGPFRNKPFCKYRGHTADLLDISWSKNYFILSSSMDKTVRLWHISRRECLCTFQHIDFVTAIVFHPRDDRYFLSGSLDGKLRLWNIPDKKVTLWNEVGSGSLITTANFCHNGKFAVVGTYDGKCIFYNTEHLKYYTQIHVRSTRGRNSKGKKITGIEPLQGEDKVLVTSNDSRVRLYDLRDLTLTCKYKGPTNTSSQIRASFSPKGRYVICGSEDHFVYIWKTQHEFYKFSSARRDRNDYYEAVKVHNAVVTTALFAPNPSHFLKCEESTTSSNASQDSVIDSNAEFFVSADFSGWIKVVKAK